MTYKLLLHHPKTTFFLNNAIKVRQESMTIALNKTLNIFHNARSSKVIKYTNLYLNFLLQIASKKLYNGCYIIQMNKDTFGI